MDELTLRDLLVCHAMFNDETDVIIQNEGGTLLATGKWYSDSVLEHTEEPIKSFSYWVPNNRAHILLK